MSAANSLLEAGHLQAGYGARRVLDGVDLRVRAGEVVGLLGPNGAGKSTLLRCVLGLQRLQAGQVVVAGRPVHALARRELGRLMAYVPQASSSGPGLTVYDMVMLGRSPHHGLHPAGHDRDVVLGVIEQLGLQALALRPCAELSGGQRQRVVLARALAQQPSVLVLDEPTSDLDLRHQLDALRSVRRTCAERGTAALVALHDLALAARCCDRLVLLHQGRVLAEGLWTDVLTPAHLATAYGVQARVGRDGGLPYVVVEDEKRIDVAA